MAQAAAYIVSSRNAPPHSWGGALRDDTKNGCVADYCVQFAKLKRNFCFSFLGYRSTNRLRSFARYVNRAARNENRVVRDRLAGRWP